ncbi:hypothetical protein BDV95DRAFT_225857 [Massariosphaeria phaeospora]|uniref:Peptidase A2 domain-containing protein n=1 Tax=Massariosphaeria phaeospora TaxID=100035 RepID=A0A7C8ICY8_9PLEO|nr:hypothetical protein BDV95DRAFT_225857 [Massariosphaeria phaeospora]
MANVRQMILVACSSGDIPTLETMFREFDIGASHPQLPYGFDRNLPEEQHPPAVVQMLEAAITGQQVAVISFLFAKFPGSSFYGSPMRTAIDTGNAQVLRAVCKLDPASADAEIGDDEAVNALGYACSKANSAELVKVLLDAGADPNRVPPFRLPGNWNVSAAVLGGLPASTFEQFFDAGYQGNDPYAVKLAVEKKRLDVLQVLFARSKTLPDAKFPPEEELTEAANKGNDAEVVAAIKRGYAARSRQRKGLVATLISKIRS